MQIDSPPEQGIKFRQLATVDDQLACDSAFLECLPAEKCLDCFVTLQTQGIDWTSVASGTPCTDVVKFLTDGKHCVQLKDDSVARDIFCKTFDACVVWDDDEMSDDQFANDEGYVNCTALTECNWPGIHRNFIGDGVCHDNIHGCYNTALCGYDGGDCCEDTCKSSSAYVECGHEGWACRNPDSPNCDPKFTSKCKNPKNDNTPDPSSVKCAEGETKYRLVMYDSFGDGWDSTKLTITPQNNKSKVVFKGGLKDGNQGTEFICLSKNATCYDVDVSGGTWGVEVSWEVKSLGEGTPTSKVLVSIWTRSVWKLLDILH